VLEWGKSLIQFQPTLTTSQQVSEVTVRWWDVAQKKEAKVTVDRTMLPNSPLRDKKQLEALEEGFKEKKEIIVDKPFTTKKEAEEYAKAQLSGIAGKMVTARGSTLGTPDLRAGSRVEILGLGDTFTGTYTVTASTHSIGAGGYITEFDARLEEKAR
jgi:phage protein D